MGEEPAQDDDGRGLPALGQNRRERHGDGKVDRDQEEKWDGPLVPIGLEDHRDAHEDRVRLTGGEAGNDAGDAFDAEETMANDG